MPGSQDQRPRSLKMDTIHGCAQAGDLPGLQKKLQENPSLLNARNPVMCQTPLHVAAGYNHINIIKYLLEYKGPDIVELEAKNMYGETPLHMAAKNSSCESVKLLLEHGSVLESKANNGMTPLHLAVWHAVQTGDCSTTSLLLGFNADCMAKDNEGKMPTNHVPGSMGCEKLKKLLTKHMEEQRKAKAMLSSREAKAMVELEESLSNLVGLQAIKTQLRTWAKGLILDEKRRAKGLNIASRKPPHMAFLGNPGTGKTLVARILGKLLHMVGILPTDKVVEVQRTDLVGEFVGHTGPKTRRKIQEAEGGILFIDEAYRLIPMQKSDDKDYGIEALEEIMSVMDTGKVVAIFAGYSEPMKRVFSSNPGFVRRVTKYFHFDNYNTIELAEILHLKMRNQDPNGLLYGFRLHVSCTVEKVAEIIERETMEEKRREINGGLVDTLLRNARESLDLRLEIDCEDENALVTITIDDLETGLRQLTNEGSY